jgi:hypothetical protein
MGSIISKATHTTQSEKIMKRLESNNCFFQPAVMSRKTVVLDIGDYRNDLPIAGDYELRVRLGRTWLLGNLSCVVMSYRVHAR